MECTIFLFLRSRLFFPPEVALTCWEEEIADGRERCPLLMIQMRVCVLCVGSCGGERNFYCEIVPLRSFGLLCSPVSYVQCRNTSSAAEGGGCSQPFKWYNVSAKGWLLMKT